MTHHIAINLLTLLCALPLTAVAAEELYIIKLRDGREFIGVYDASKQTVDIRRPFRAQVAVKESDIVSKSRYEEAEGQSITITRPVLKSKPVDIRKFDARGEVIKRLVYECDQILKSKVKRPKDILVAVDGDTADADLSNPGFAERATSTVQSLLSSSSWPTELAQIIEKNGDAARMRLYTNEVDAMYAANIEKLAVDLRNAESDKVRSAKAYEKAVAKAAELKPTGGNLFATREQVLKVVADPASKYKTAIYRYEVLSSVGERLKWFMDRAPEATQHKELTESIAAIWPPSQLDMDKLLTLVSDIPAKSSTEKTAEYNDSVADKLRPYFPDWGLAATMSADRLIWCSEDLPINNYSADNEAFIVNPYQVDRRKVANVEEYELTGLTTGVKGTGRITVISGGFMFDVGRTLLLSLPVELVKGNDGFRVYLGSGAGDAQHYLNGCDQTKALSMANRDVVRGWWHNIKFTLRVVVIVNKGNEIVSVYAIRERGEP